MKSMDQLTSNSTESKPHEKIKGFPYYKYNLHNKILIDSSTSSQTLSYEEIKEV